MADKDTYLKLLSQTLSGGAMFPLGVDGVELVDHLPTEVPAGGFKIDTAWRMQDGRVFHLEYQSERESPLYRMLNSDVRAWPRAMSAQCARWSCITARCAVRPVP